MTEKPPLLHQRIFSKQYQGPTEEASHNRGVDRFEQIFGTLGLDFDEVITLQLEKAVAYGESEVVVLDVGSGDAGIFREFLTDPDANVITREFLEAHQDVSLKLIGLTDALSPDAFFTEKPLHLKQQSLPLDQVQAHNYYYTLTRNQDLAHFLEKLGVSQLNMMLAIQSFRYMNGRAFKEVLSTALAKMPVGGQILIDGYFGSLPGFKGTWGDKGLDVHNRPENPSLGRYINEYTRTMPNWAAAERSTYPDRPQRLQLAQKAWQLFERISKRNAYPFFQQSDVDTARAPVENELNLLSHHYSDPEKEELVIAATIHKALLHLAQAKKSRDRDRKLQVMANLPNVRITSLEEDSEGKKKKIGVSGGASTLMVEKINANAG